MSIGVLLLVILCVLLIAGGLPSMGGQWHSYGYWPSGFGVLLLVVLLLVIWRGGL